MLPADVSGAPSRNKSLSCNSNRRFAIFVSWPVRSDEGQEDLQPAALVRKNSARHRVQGVHGEKPRHVADGGVERIEAARLSRRREAHHQRTERLFCNPGLSTGVGPEHGQGINAPHESDHNLALRPNGYRAHERSCAKSRGKFWRQVWRQFWRQLPAQKYPETFVDQQSGKTAKCAKWKAKPWWSQ